MPQATGTHAPAMDRDALDLLRRTHPAWRLLLAEHAPLILAFLHRAFIVSNTRSVSQQVVLAGKSVCGT